jgi:hypothetical protein
MGSWVPDPVQRASANIGFKTASRARSSCLMIDHGFNPFMSSSVRDDTRDYPHLRNACGLQLRVWLSGFLKPRVIRERPLVRVRATVIHDVEAAGAARVTASDVGYLLFYIVLQMLYAGVQIGFPIGILCGLRRCSTTVRAPRGIIVIAVAVSFVLFPTMFWVGPYGMASYGEMVGTRAVVANAPGTLEVQFEHHGSGPRRYQFSCSRCSRSASRRRRTAAGRR